MKERWFNLMLAAVVLAIALGYYFGHGLVQRLMLNAGAGLVRLAGS